MAKGIKKYILMHKEIPVADIEIDEATCLISAIGSVYSAAHAPVGIVKKGIMDRTALNDWWRGRAIPASRDGIEKALAELNISTTYELLEKCLGLSLSDQYWICPAGSDIKWSQINFFENSFSDDMGNVLLGSGISNNHISLMSPDNTSDGWLKKKWKIIDGKRCLIKGGSGAVRQEPYNEVLASCIMERLNIPHVKYSLLIEDDYPYSVCEDFITTETDFISAWHIMRAVKKRNHVSVYEHYLNCCEKFGVPDIKDSVENMIVVDYLIANADRHLNNFGVIRNAETLEYLGAAQIFDCGTSLWFDKPVAMIGEMEKVGCKPFKNNHDVQIKLVGSLDRFDLMALNGIDEEFREITKGSIFIDEKRKEAVCRALKGRVDRLSEIRNNPALLGDY